jgi:hypothetical protein
MIFQPSDAQWAIFASRTLKCARSGSAERLQYALAGPRRSGVGFEAFLVLGCSRQDPQQIGEQREVFMLDEKLLGELVESMTQMGGIARAERKPLREFHGNAEIVKKLRRQWFESAGVRRCPARRFGRLRNRERGIRERSGPPKALLTAIKNEPKNVLYKPTDSLFDVRDLTRSKRGIIKEFLLREAVADYNLS